MKRTRIVMIAVMTALVFTACSKAPQNTETVKAPAVTQEETSGKAETSPPVSLAAPGAQTEFKVFTAEVVSVADTLTDMTVKNGDANLKIMLDGVDVETSFELDKGTSVSIVYKGEISGADASNAKILMVLDAQEDMQVKTMIGSVKDQAMSSFTIHPDTGDDVSFMKDNCEGLNTGVLGQASDDKNGSGVMVKVTYVSVDFDAGVTNFPLKVESASGK